MRRMALFLAALPLALVVLTPMAAAGPDLPGARVETARAVAATSCLQVPTIRVESAQAVMIMLPPPPDPGLTVIPPQEIKIQGCTLTTQHTVIFWCVWVNTSRVPPAGFGEGACPLKP